MDTLLHDQRVRVVLRQLPRLLSTAVALEDKLDELCVAAAEVLGADVAAVVLLGEDTPLLAHAGGIGADVLETLLDAERLPSVVDSGVVSLTDEARTGLLVALRNEAQTLGALYVARGAEAPFSDDETEVAQLLAEAVGPAVHYGVRLLNTERGERWSDAAVRLTELLLGDLTDDPYAAIVDVVWDLGEADVVGIAVPQEGDEIHIQYVRGMGLERLNGVRVPTGMTYPEELRRAGRGQVADMSTYDSPWAASNLADSDLGPLIAVPVRGATGPLAVLYLARRRDAPGYLRDHLAKAETFAVSAALSMEWHSARTTHDELRMLQERNRIARDLHDNVVQRLFATGLYLQQASRTLEGETRERVVGAMTAIDQTIRQIRNTILVLRSTAADRLDSLLTTIVAETAPLLGFPPHIAMSPEVSKVTGPLAADLALCVREALSNVVQHAHAESVEIEVSVEESTVVLRISDDGVGIEGDPRPGGGLENLDERARAHGGTFTYVSDPGQGTTLRWRMPLAPRG